MTTATNMALKIYAGDQARDQSQPVRDEPATMPK